MKKIICMLLLIQSGFIIAQTKTVVTQYGEKVTISPLANNGLTQNNGYTQLGGALTKASVLTTTSAYTLAIAGLQAGTASDNVLVSDANGVLKYVARSSFGGNDNLGNHTATMDLTMSGKNINNAANITATGKSSTQTAQISKGTDGIVPAAGYVATSADASGNIVWKDAITLTVKGDNLGNHTASRSLNMGGHAINNSANTDDTKGLIFDATGNGTIQQQLKIMNIPDAATTEKVLTVGTDGLVKKGTIDLSSIPQKYTYSIPALANEQSGSITTLSRTSQYMVTVTTGNACGRVGVAVFMVYNGVITFLGGQARNGEYNATILDPNGASLNLSGSINTVCQDQGGLYQFNFNIAITNQKTITITNKNGTIAQTYNITVMEN